MPLGFVNASVGPAGSSTGFLGATEYRTDVVAGDYNNLSVSKGSSRFPLESVRARGTACIKAAFAVELGYRGSRFGGATSGGLPSVGGC